MIIISETAELKDENPQNYLWLLLHNKLNSAASSRPKLSKHTVWIWQKRHAEKVKKKQNIAKEKKETK